MKISTSKLAIKLNIQAKDLFDKLLNEWYIELSDWDDKWIITEKWMKSWWEIKNSKKFWNYIVWPEDISFEKKPLEAPKIITKQNLISVSKVAENFGIWARRANQIISELWWTEKTIKWWFLTDLWKSVWWKEFKHTIFWVSYTKWPESILENSSFLHALWIDEKEPEEIEIIEKVKKIIKKDELDLDFRDKFPAKYRTKDGHNVRSRWEVLIDNALYEYGLAHAYERKLPIEEDVYSDFYIPSKNWSKAVYIEYWGIEENEKYSKRKDDKIAIYKKYNLNLLSLENKHIDNLDDYLPMLLLEYWIKVD